MPEGKRNELTDMAASLRAFASKGNPTKEANAQRRHLFQRIIQYVTIGIDMSPLFSDVIMNAHTTDMATKKMLYHYITHYARVKADLALLTVNTLQKDARDDDPVVRGLAIRSMASLRVPDLVEYLIEAIRLGLKDAHPYPRKTASISVLKAYDLDEDALRETEILDEVRRMLATDRDPGVVTNCLITLREIDGEAAVATKQNVYGLINRIKDFGEFSQVTILETVATYVPKDKSETFDVMNALEDRLQHSNSAVVLATVKVFLGVTLQMPDVHQQVFERLKAPLLTLAAVGASETSYVVWAHLHLLVTRAPPLFVTDFKSFFCRASDSPAVKKLKIEMLTAACDASNAYDIVTELSEYVGDVDAAIARESVKAVGRIALDGDQDVSGIVDRLLQFLDHGTDYVTAETLVMIKDLLRRHPKWADECVLAVSAVDAESVTEPSARAAIVWVMGEYGHVMPEAPYALEPLVDEFETEESEEVRLELLSAAAKLFFKRPPEMKRTLGKALHLGCQDANQDVHDRAMMYARLLRHDPAAAGRVIGCEKATINRFTDIDSADKHSETIFSEFNTLSVLYRKPAFLFTEDAPKVIRRAPSSASGGDGDGGKSGGAGTSAMLDASLIDLSDGGGGGGGGGGGSANDLNDLLGGPSTGGGPSPAGGNSANNLLDLIDVPLAAATSAAPPPPPLTLTLTPALDAATFQRKWGALAASPGCVGGPRTLPLGPRTPALLTTPPPLMHHLARLGWLAMASGGAPPALKFYFYAQPVDQSEHFLVEATVDSGRCVAATTMKTDASPAVAAAGEALFAAALASFGA
jgi:vesicle coat complex subunit